MEERFDRAMGTPDWHSRFPGASLYNMVAPVFDHNLLLLDTKPTLFRSRRRHFWFKNRWLMESQLKSVVQKAWEGFKDFHIVSRLEAIGEVLNSWGNQSDSLFHLRKRTLEQKFEELQNNVTNSAMIEYGEVRAELGKLLIQEEAIWKQRAKLFWLKDEDLNTKFFHQSASMRRKRNHI